VPPAADSRALHGRVIGDRYRVTELIGEGGMGEVYEAQNLAIGRMVAVKVLHPKRAQDREAISRLRHEARVAGTLGHPNICAVYDLGRLDDGSPYLVMERLHGETLAQRLEREGALSVEDLIEVILQVLSALVAAHQQGIIHRDLKPDNIFLSRREGMSPVPKLLDFGISKSEDLEDSMAEPMGDPVGTPYYMAPEQARGERNVDLRVDLWAIGVILHECLTGQRPFEAKNYNALLVAILTAKPPSVDVLKPGIPPGLVRIVDKAMAKDPNARFQSAKELQQAIRTISELEGQPQSRRVALPRDPELTPVSSQQMPPMPQSEPHPGSSRGPSTLRESEGQPGSSKRRPSISQPDQQPVSSKRLPPIILQESTNDDQDSTYVFSRADMGFVVPEEADAPELEVVEEENLPVYLPFTDEEEQTLIERPAFLNELSDTITTVRKSTPPPRRKD
jgi:serine/threonine protein kinase